MKKILVIGASEEVSRYANKAIKALLAKGYAVEAISKKAGEVDGIKFHTDRPNFKNIDTVTLYLNPERQKDFYNYLIGLQPRRIIFNPGAENIEFEKLAQDAGILTEQACTLVLLSIGNF